MASDIAAAQVDGAGSDVHSEGRDIKGHILFEIATEVANRGQCFGKLRYGKLMLHSGRDLFGVKVESPSDYARIWG